MDFPFPNGLDPDLIYENMKLVLEKMDYLGELSIMAYVDKETFADELLHAYKKAGVTILPRQGILKTLILFVCRYIYIM